MEAANSAQKKKRKNKRPGKGEREKRKAQLLAGAGGEREDNDDDNDDDDNVKHNPTLSSREEEKGDKPTRAPSGQPTHQPNNKASRQPSAQPGYSFEVDYNDHFETPFVAYRDLKPFLELSLVGADPLVYDPYYCQGRVCEYLQRLGYSRVVNENADFYQRVRDNCVPKHDILVTNPPYSGEHKQQLLAYLLARSCVAVRPFALLLPAYTATKSYWREFVEKTAARHGEASAFLYLMPPSSYEYDHPEGTGKELPPFYSCWFLGGFPSSRSTYIEKGLARSGLGLLVLRSVEALVEKGFVVAKRPNPKRRKKMVGDHSSLLHH